jgi:aminopeptidase N
MESTRRGYPGSMRRLLLAAFASTVLAAAPAAAAAPPSPGAPGVGDRLFPSLGNGGYDVIHYDLDLRYETAAPSQSIDGDVTILARSKQSLSRFNLDFAGAGPGSVSVNGRSADWTREGEELVITPRRPIAKGKRFVVKVADFVAVPTEPSGEDPRSTGFFITPHGTATAPQPDLAHLIFPSNDHPSDKASYTFRFDVPSGIVAVANGVPTGRRERDGRATWSYLQRQPMATELLQLAVGGYDLLWAGRHRGVPIRNVIAPTLREVGDPAVALTPQHLDWMTARAGRYPFDIYGSLIVDAELGFALETQTISLYDKVWFTEYGQGTWDPTMVHELSHEWFGNSVSPEAWSDLWLNEGHASWYEFVYAEEHGFLAEDTTGYPDETGYATLEELMRAVYAHGDQWRADSGPVAQPSSPETLFDFQRYHGGALVLYALREKIGNRAFERLERAWVRRYANESVGTDEFIALASQVAHRDLSGFLRNWLYGTTTPPMPNHPDWTVDPVEAEIQALRLGRAARPTP